MLQKHKNQNHEKEQKKNDGNKGEYDRNLMVI